MSGQIALRLVEGAEEGNPAQPRSASDEALLAHFVSHPQRALRQARTLRGLLAMSPEDLERCGVDAGEARRIRAAVELGRRYIESTIDRGQALSKPADTARALTSRLGDLEHEVFACLHLDNRHRIIGFEEMFRGTIDGATVHVREVVKRCMVLNSAAIVVCHNHPSGCCEPSRSDKAITKRLQEAVALVGVRLLDHFVIGDGEVMSFAERGWL